MRTWWLALGVLVALSRPARADDLDDLDIGPPVAPSAAASAAPAKPGAVKPEDDDDILKDLPTLGGGGGKVTEAPAALPGGFKDAWNLVEALAFVRETKLDFRPHEPPFTSWQQLRVNQEVTAILAGASDLPASLKDLVRHRLDTLLGGQPDEETERLGRELAVLDHPEGPRAQESARQLARKAGDEAIGPRLAAAALHGTDLVAYTDRLRALLHAPAGVDWTVRQLASGDATAVQAALDYARDGAPGPELRGLIAALAAGKVPEAAVGPLWSAIGTAGTEELLPDLANQPATGAAARALGECEGRIRQRAEELSGWSASESDRRDVASRANQAGIPLFRSAHYREALAKFRLASALDPSDSNYRFNLGHALARLGNVTDGVVRMKEAVAQSPDEIPMYENLLASLRDLGDRAALVSYLEERSARVQYSAVVVLVHLNLAHEYLCLGKPAQAHQELDIAFASAVPERYLTPLLTRRGDAFMLTGDVAHARRAYEQALASGPENRRALDGMLRADAWQLPGETPASLPIETIAGDKPPVATGPAAAAAAADPIGLDPLDDPDPFAPATATKKAPAAPAPAASAPAPQASPSPKVDDLDLDGI